LFREYKIAVTQRAKGIAGVAVLDVSSVEAIPR
jgi:hypothetical protein